MFLSSSSPNIPVSRYQMCILLARACGDSWFFEADFRDWFKDLESFSVIHIDRYANGVADCFAKFVVSLFYADISFYLCSSFCLWCFDASCLRACLIYHSTWCMYTNSTTKFNSSTKTELKKQDVNIFAKVFLLPKYIRNDKPNMHISYMVGPLGP